MNEPIERNRFTEQWLDDAKAAGFTESQLNFLEKYYRSPETLDDLL